MKKVAAFFMVAFLALLLAQPAEAGNGNGNGNSGNSGNSGSSSSNSSGGGNGSNSSASGSVGTSGNSGNTTGCNNSGNAHACNGGGGNGNNGGGNNGGSGGSGGGGFSSGGAGQPSNKGPNGMVLMLVTDPTASAEEMTIPGQQPMSPSQAAKLDRKMDDGRPDTGKIQAYGLTESCFGEDGMSYNESVTSKDCGVYFTLSR